MTLTNSGVSCWQCDRTVMGTPITIVSTVDRTFKRKVCLECYNVMKVSEPNLWRTTDGNYTQLEQVD